jgi:amino acid adenylation domain-containing protein
VRPAAPAVRDGTVSATFAELDRWSEVICGGLVARGVGAGCAVALLVPRSAALVAGALGIMRAGGAYLPIEESCPAQRLEFMLRDAGCRVVVTSRELETRVPAGPWSSLIAGGPPGPEAAAAVGPRPWPDLDSLAYVIYTSGSTGQPKGVEVTHRNLANLCAWTREAFAIRASDRASQVNNPAFDAAGWEIWPHITAGASVHVADEDTRRDMSRLRDWLLSRGVTIATLPTAMTEIAMTLEWPEDGTLRLLLTGGDTLHRRPPASLPFAVVNNYGPTECTVVTTSGRVAPSVAGRGDGAPSVGRPIDNVTVRILDPDLRPVPSGTPGELFVGGEAVARGYRNRAALTAERFVPDPETPGGRLYRTGDRVTLRPDGEIAFLGRLDDQVQVRGHRVEPAEVAAALSLHPAVRSALVTAWEPVEGDRRLVAYVVASPEATPAALRAFLAGRLPSHMVPAYFHRLDALPLTSRGKVDRAALPGPDRFLQEEAAGAVPPRTPLEERIGGIAAGLLGLERVGADQDFFLLGGHSLLAVQLASRLRAAYGVEVPLEALFDGPTVAAMAAEVERLLIERLETMSDEDVRRSLGPVAAGGSS